MIKQMAWNTFKNTGSIDSYLELAKVQNIEKNIKKDGITNEEIEIKNNIKEDLH